MNFNIYINRDIGEKITKTAAHLHRSRNSIITEDVQEWLDRHVESSWPKDFFSFEPIHDVPDFKESRKDFEKNISEDPLE